VLHLLLVLVPLGLAASVSPVMLTEQTVLLAVPGRRRAGLLYAAGAATVLVLLVAAVLVMGRSLSLPTAPHLDATLDLVVGGALVALALAVYLVPARERQPSRRGARQLGPVAALGFGVFSMGTNVTTLALVVPAAKEIAAAPVPMWGRLLAAALLVALACLPAWGPVVLVAAAPRAAGRFLHRVEDLLHRHGRLLAVLLVGGAGLFLVGRGVIRLAAL